MICGKTVWLAVNSASGSNSEAALRTLAEAFDRATCTVGRQLVFHDDGAPSMEELRSNGIDLLVIFTGDGTVNALVTGLYGWEGAVLVLPGGTMNLLAKRLHGDVEPTEIIARVAAGRARRVRPNIVRSRHGDGLTGILAGPGTSWGQVREALRETDVVGTISTAAEAITESTAGPKVFCGEPHCGREEGYSAIQVTPAAEGLAVEGYYVETLGDYAKHTMALLKRNFREGPHDDLGCHPSVGLVCRDGEEMGLLIDGEPHDARSEETFTLARCGVDLLTTIDE